jgi:LPS export ABC transporter protein LptC
MTKWLRRARFVVAGFLAALAVILVLAFRGRHTRPVPLATAGRSDPTAIVESTSGRVIRFNGTRADVTVEYERQLTYRDGSTKLLNVRVVTDKRAGGRTFTALGKEGAVGQNDSTITLDGDVAIHANDGLTVKTEHAVYTSGDGLLHAPGSVQFDRSGLNGTGVGMTYDKNQDQLVVINQAEIHLSPKGENGPTDVSSGGATVARPEHEVRFERVMRGLRFGQLIGADGGIAHLSGDDEQVERVELHGNASVVATKAEVGALQSLTGRDMDLVYRTGGNGLERVRVVGAALLQLAGEEGAPGRQISADTLDIAFAEDGSTPTALAGRDGVQLRLPPDGDGATRTIGAADLEGHGDGKKGLSSLTFTGDVEFREKSPMVERTGRAAMLQVTMETGHESIEDATFSRGARFTAENGLVAAAAVAKYVLRSGALELSGTEPASPRPRMTNEQIAVNATRVEATIDGPKVKATGDVRSVLQPPKNTSKDGKPPETKMPSMLKDDQPVSVIGDYLDYDGSRARASYEGGAKLWQVDTSVQGDSLVVDNKNGDLSASGSAATSSMLKQGDKDKKTTERVRTIGTSKTFAYEDSTRRATYSGDAHLNGPQGDMTAEKIELYLRPSGDEVDRAEAYDKMTLREQSRKTTGGRMTYTADTETYIVTGAPVRIVDGCGRETVGKKVTFVKSTNTVDVDSGDDVRTQTKGGKCS